MVLSSQMSRSGTGRSNMFARRHHRKKPWLAITVVAVLGLTALWWFKWRDSGSANANTPANANALSASMSDTTGGSGPGAVGGNRGNNIGDSSSSANLPAGITADTTTSQVPSNQTEPSDQSALTNGHNDPNRSIVMGEKNSEESPLDSRSDLPSENGGDESPRQNLPNDSFGADPSIEVQRKMASAEEMLRRSQNVEARRLFNEALNDPAVGRALPTIRRRMAEINQTLIFSPYIDDNDPFTERHVMRSTDRLVNLARATHVDWRFLARINNISDPRKVREGQTIKIVNGPFHVVVDKSDFRMDVYIGNADREGRRMYVRSFPVGLGEFNSTPVGSWIVKKNSKTTNPAWTNSRTGEHFSRDNPKNPIGEFWIGLSGIDADTQSMRGYGIHGTIDPQSIGNQASMGCIRMLDDEIALVYEMLIPEQSTVIIKP